MQLVPRTGRGPLSTKSGRKHLARHCFAATLVTMLPVPSAVPHAPDWPQWCGTAVRNMVCDEKGLPLGFDEAWAGESGAPHLHNVRWVARLGQENYGSPVIDAGKVLIGGCDRGAGSHDALGILRCFRESDGAPLWQFRSPYVKNLYNRSFGICSTPTIEGDRVFLLGHLGEVLCLDAKGLADGNDGPFKDEEALLATHRKLVTNRITPDGSRVVAYSSGEGGKLTTSDADIIWQYDMIKGVNCWPFNALNAAILIRGDRLYVPTCSANCRETPSGGGRQIDAWKKKEGTDFWAWLRLRLGLQITPRVCRSPSLIVLDKNTGTLLAADETGAFEGSFHGAQSSPALGMIGGKELLVWGGGNGICYAIDPNFQPGADGAPGTLKTVWQYDCIAPASYDKGSIEKRPKDRVEIVATPVIYHGRVYIAVGNDLKDSGSDAPRGRLLCIDATRTGDITGTGKIWSFDDIRSSSSTVAIADGLVYAADVSGMVYCLDAETGRPYWSHKTSPVWASPLKADDKVFIPTRGGGLLVMAAGKEKRVISESRSRAMMTASPAAANGVLYVVSRDCLYAAQDGQLGQPPPPRDPGPTDMAPAQ